VVTTIKFRLKRLEIRKGDKEETIEGGIDVWLARKPAMETLEGSRHKRRA